MPNLSKFPDEIDVFIDRYDALASDIPHLKRIQELQLKENKTPAESNELTNLLITYRDKMFLAEDLNKLQHAMVAMQQFLKGSVNDYILNKQNEFNSYIDTKTSELETEQTNAINSINSTKTTAETNIQSTKDSALLAIENKKNNVIEYLDGTTAGQLRNDIGDMSLLTTTEKTSLVGAVNEVNAKNPIHIGTTPPSDITKLWVDIN